MTRIYAFFIPLLLFCLSANGVLAQDAHDRLHQAMKQYDQILPQEKAYMHTDRSFYKPGEVIWFKTYLTDGGNNASQLSPIVYAELVNPRGAVEQKRSIPRHTDAFYGEFTIPASAPGGIYKVRSYTKWMMNAGEEHYYFEKEITVQGVVMPRLLMKLDFEKEAYGPGDEVTATLEVRDLADTPLSHKDCKTVLSIAGEKVKDFSSKTDGLGNADITFTLPKDLNSNDGLINVMLQHNGSTESISRSVPIVLNNIDIEFFAEGGDIIQGTRNKVAFKAFDEFGKPADIAGILVDAGGKEVASFESFHQGMGAFAFKPLKGNDYTVKITRPEGISKTYDLPKILDNAIGLRILEQTEDGMTLSIHSPSKQQVHLVCYLAGKLQRVIPMETLPGDNKLKIPTNDMPVGILQMTLFNDDLVPQAERLAFVNKHREIKVELKTDKEKYLPQENVTLSIKVTDDSGKGIPGDFSLAVVDDQIHTFADDKQDNILSYLLMTSELKGEIEEPNFYFDPTEEKAARALDYVMMTHGWRRFQWRDVLAAKEKELIASIKHPADKLSAVGRLIVDGQPIPHTRVWLQDKSQYAKTDKNGYFAFDNVALPVYVKTRYRGIPAQCYISNYSTVPQVVPGATKPGRNRPIAAVKDKDNRLFADAADMDDLVADVEMVEVEEEAPAERELAEVLADKVEGLKIVAADKELVQKADIADAKPRFKEEAKKAKMPARAARREVADEMMAGEMIEEEPLLLQEVVVAGVAAPAPAAANVANAPMDMNRAGGGGKGVAYDFGTGAGYRRPNVYMQPVYNGTVAMNYGRQFYAPRYNQHNRLRSNPSDVRKTLFWSPIIRTNDQGEASVTYSNSSEVSTYRIILEGISRKGQVIRGESTYATQKAMSVDVKAPVAVTHGDKVILPITIHNNTQQPLTGNIIASNLQGMALQGDKGLNRPVTIPANSTHTEYFEAVVGKDMKGIRNYTFTFQSPQGTETVNKQIELNPKGFPRAVSLSSKELQRSFTFEVSDILDNSLEGVFTMYPNIMDELVSGTESILREPNGCFEQTSSSNYPNIMALQYMQEQGKVDPALEKRAKGYLQRGYARLVGYECSGGGFEWFGSDPAHETLTAYGLVQFEDMKSVYKGVDQAMIDRTAEWLVSRKDGKGGFNQRGRGLDAFRGSSYEVGNAYIVYALSEVGYKDIKKEVAHSTAEALKSKDAYCLALAAIANHNLGNKAEAQKCLKALKPQIMGEVEKMVVAETVTRSYGKNRFIETTGMYISAMLRDKSYTDDAALEKLVLFLSQNRAGGGFGSTQATILSLKAFTAYAKYKGKAKSGGRARIYVNGSQVKEFVYEVGHRGKMEADLTPFLKEGKNEVTVSFDRTEEALPYAADISWTSLTPDSSPDCRVDLETSIAAKEVKVGETLRLTANITNKLDEEIPTPIALIGIPAGLSLQPWQLKELVDKKVMDFYEIQGNYLVAYFTKMDAGKERVLNLDLKADIPGTYKAPASTAYLYYDKQDKDWDAGQEVTVTK